MKSPVPHLSSHVFTFQEDTTKRHVLPYLIFLNMKLIPHLGCSIALENLSAVDYFPSGLLFKASICVTLLLTTTQNSMTSITRDFVVNDHNIF
jgi:hypothetical protein